MPEPVFASRNRAQSPLINAALLSAAALLVAGIFAPLLTVERLLIFSDTISLASALIALAREGYLVLFAVLVAFSVLFPIAKLAGLFYLWNYAGYESPRLDRLFQWIGRYGKWSMLDVFVVAVLVVGVKLQLIADVQIRFGLYVFGASVLLTMLVSGRIARLIDAPPGSERHPRH